MTKRLSRFVPLLALDPRFGRRTGAPGGELHYFRRATYLVEMIARP